LAFGYLGWISKHQAHQHKTATSVTAEQNGRPVPVGAPT